MVGTVAGHHCIPPKDCLMYCSLGVLEFISRSLVGGHFAYCHFCWHCSKWVLSKKGPLGADTGALLS